MNQLFQSQDSGADLTCEAFDKFIGQPLRLASFWFHKNEEKFKDLAKDSESWQKLKHDFQTNVSTRRAIQAGIEKGQNIEQSLPDTQLMLEDLERKLKQKNKSTDPANAAAVGQSPQKSSETATDHLMSTFGVDLGPDSDVQQPLEHLTDAERLAMI